MSSVIVPLVKCKTKDLSDVNNYRAIAISNTISKLFESVVLNDLLLWQKVISCNTVLSMVCLLACVQMFLKQQLTITLLVAVTSSAALLTSVRHSTVLTIGGYLVNSLSDGVSSELI